MAVLGRTPGRFGTSCQFPSAAGAATSGMGDGRRPSRRGLVAPGQVIERITASLAASRHNAEYSLDEPASRSLSVPPLTLRYSTGAPDHAQPALSVGSTSTRRKVQRCPRHATTRGMSRPSSRTCTRAASQAVQAVLIDDRLYRRAVRRPDGGAVQGCPPRGACPQRRQFSGFEVESLADVLWCDQLAEMPLMPRLPTASLPEGEAGGFRFTLGGRSMGPWRSWWVARAAPPDWRSASQAPR